MRWDYEAINTVTPWLWLSVICYLLFLLPETREVNFLLHYLETQETLQVETSELEYDVHKWIMNDNMNITQI